MSQSFREYALIDIAREKVSDEVHGYLVAAINLIVDKGYANPHTYYLRAKLEDPDTHIPYTSEWDETEYYGSRSAVNYSLTREALQDFAEHGLDYSKCTDPAEHTGRGFAGTFTDSHESFKYLKCILTSNNGNVYIYTLDIDDYGYRSKISGFADLITKLGDYKDFDIQYVAQNRLENLVDVYNQPINWEWVLRYGK